VVAGTDDEGAQRASTIFAGYLGYKSNLQVPDFLVVDGAYGSDGAGGVRAAGFWDNRWRADPALAHLDPPPHAARGRATCPPPPRAGWGRADFAVLGGAIGLVVGLAVGVLAPLAAFYLPSAFRTRGRGGGGPGGGPPGPAAARWRGREGRHGPMEPLLEDVASA